VRRTSDGISVGGHGRSLQSGQGKGGRAVLPGTRGFPAPRF
jgi:hypothetical protein